MHVRYNLEKRQTILFPDVEMDSAFSESETPSLVVSSNGVRVTLLNRRIDASGRWNMVQFAPMNKADFQEYINELQVICNSLQGVDSHD